MAGYAQLNKYEHAGAPPYGAIDAHAHQTSLDLLEEVAEYLRRLPVHPMTHAMVNKIQAHLQDPQQVARTKRLSTLAEAQSFTAKLNSGHVFRGHAIYASSGAPLFAYSLQYPELRLTSPAMLEAREEGDEAIERMAERIGLEIAAGVTVLFKPVTLQNGSDVT